MKKIWTLRSAPRALAISALGAMAISVASFSVAAAQDVKNSASSSSTVSATIDGRPGESYEIVTEDGSSTAFHILENGDRLPVPLTQKEDGSSEIVLGDGEIVEILPNSYGNSQSWSESSDGSASSNSYSGNSNNRSSSGLSDYLPRRSGEANRADRERDRYRNMGKAQRERLQNMRENQRKRLEEMSGRQWENWNSSSDGEASSSESGRRYGNRDSRYNYRNYRGAEGRENRRQRMDEMRQRLLDMQGVSNLEELMAGRRTSSMDSAQRQLDSAMRQLEKLQENGNTSPALKKALRDLEKAQKSIDEAKQDAGD